MIADQFHPLDDLALFGHTVHGLVRTNVSTTSLVVDGVEFPLSAHYSTGLAGDPGVLQVVKHPDAGPLDLPEEVLAAERALGRVWQNYALLQRNGMIFGGSIGGWVHIDGLGRRWAIRPGPLVAAAPDAPYALTLECVPFGYLDGAPMEAVSLPVSCSDLEQLTAGSRVVAFETINSTGSRCILRLTQSGLTLPSGFLEITLSDSGGTLSAVMSVLKSQADVRGTWTTSHPGIASPAELYVTRAICPTATLTGHVIDGGVPHFPVGGGTVNLSITGFEVREDVLSPWIGLYARYQEGEVTVSSGRTGRVLALAFDEADVLVETTYDTTYEYTGSMPAWTGTAVGEMSNSGDGDFINHTPWTIITAPALNVSRTLGESITQTLTLRRNGIEAVGLTNTKSYSVAHAAGLSPGEPGDLWWWASVGLEGGEVVQGVALAPYVPGSDVVAIPTLMAPGLSEVTTALLSEKGGPWPESTSAPLDTTGRGDPELAGEVPVGTTERDADTLQMGFGPVSYLVGGHYAGVRLRESGPVSGATLVREIALLYPHAELLARGVVNDLLSMAYHPVEHIIETSTDPALDILFV